MILTCPNCDTQYVVKDGAIPPGGRQVRCASCKHSWHQEPDGPVEQSAEELQAQSAALPEDPVDAINEEYVSSAEQRGQQREEPESFAEAAMIEPRSGPELEERAYEEAVIEGAADPAQNEPALAPSAADSTTESMQEPDSVQEDWREPPVAEATDDDFSPFRASGEVETSRRSPIVTILLVALVVAAIAAAFWFLAPPEWKATLGLGGASASPLAFVATHVDRQRLESGNELLTLTGRVINPTKAEQTVPPLKAELRAAGGRVIYSWTIAPPASRLAPGASATFNSAEVNVPAGGDEVTISADTPRA